MGRTASRSCSLLLLFASFGTATGAERPPAALDECRKALHVLQRLGFGARPGDVERVLSLGIQRYVEQQLSPEWIDDPIADTKLGSLPTLVLEDADLAEKFEKPLNEARRFVEKSMEPSSLSAENAGREIQRRVDELVSPAERPQRVLDELTRARVLRAVYSERQLNEVLVDFWMNHFNVFGGKGEDRILLTSFERDVIRPHIWGCFRDLLVATARSPAMLVYLDNAQSVAVAENRAGAPPLPLIPFAGKPRPGLNENYARELLELHTLGVDGGYTQLDVTELARVFTGWTLAPPEEGGGFLFRANLHDVCPKTVLDHRTGEGRGLDEGEEMLALLARHPATARRIAWKLCRRLVADDPPRRLVERVASRFLATDGDLRETVRAIIESPEFFDPAVYRAKLKSPFEFVVSALRATAATTDGGPSVSRRISEAGEPLYLCQPPTGYPDTTAEWMSTGGFLSRLNFALELASNRLGGTGVLWSDLLSTPVKNDPARLLDALSRLLLGGDLSENTRRQVQECVLERATGNGDSNVALAAAALLGSPEFQRR